MKKHLELILKRTIPDYITMMGIIPFVFSIYFLLKRNAELALILIGINFFIDSVDGLVARKLNQSTEFGRQLDSSMDLLIYLVFPSLFVLNFLNYSTIASLIASMLIILFGILRLLRFNNRGFIHKGEIMHYPGLGTAYVLPVVAIMFILKNWIGDIADIALYVLLVLISFAMISDVPIRKPRLIFWYPVALSLIIILIYLHLQK